MRSDSSSTTFLTTARRDQLVTVTIDTLARLGYAATSVAAIADRAGVSKGVVSYHFSSRDELMREVVTRVLAEAEAAMTPRIVAAASYTEALHNYIDNNLDYLTHHRSEAAALVEVLASARDVAGLPEIWEQAHAAAVAGLVDIFDGGRRAGEFGDVPSDVLALSLRATIDAAAAELRRRDFPVAGGTAAADAADPAAYGARIRLLFDRAVRPLQEQAR